MGEQSKIEWTTHTFNPWIGCEKVSAGCKHCYAERDTSNRVSTARGLPLWGPGSTRHRTSAANWRKPLAWNRKARMGREAHSRHGGEVSHGPWQRPRVFCASLADVFEGGRPELDAMRADLWRLIEQCDELDWLLLTKRPENVKGMVPLEWLGGGVGWPRHVWIGTTVENQAMADERIPHLLRTPAAVRFLSVEPLLGPVDLESWVKVSDARGGTFAAPLEVNEPPFRHVDWVIVGGESGPNARPMHPDWVRSIRDQCEAAAVPFFFKQWGEWYAATGERKAMHDEEVSLQKAGYLGDRQHLWLDNAISYRLGKKAAGRILDGRTWDELPRNAQH